MSQFNISLEGDQHLIGEIDQLLVDPNIAKSKPVQKDSLADPLDSPLGADEIKNIIEIITIVLKGGTALTAFVQAVRKILAGAPGKVLVVRDPASGKKKGVITGVSSDGDIEKLVSK